MVVSDGFWRRVFDADPDVVGRAVTVDGTSCIIAGVLPPSYRIFHVLNRELEVYRPLVMDPSERTGTLNLWARLKPGTPVEAADAQLKTVYATLPLPDAGWSVAAALLSTRFAAGPKPVLVALEWAVALVLLIACANVANLVLAASAARRTELAVRQALGAGRWRIARDLGGETLLVVAAGSALAIVIAVWVVDLLNSIVSFQDVNRLEPFRVDRWVLAFTVALSAGVAMLFGMLPVRTAGSIDIVEALKDTAHGASAGLSNRRMRRVLIVAEVGLAIVLAVAAVTLTRSAIALHGLARGVTTDGVMTAQIALNDPRYENPERMVRVTTAIADRLAQSPAVDSVALVNYMPLSAIAVSFETAVEGVPPPPDRPWLARYFVVSPNYLRTTGIPLITGRDFTAADDRQHAGVAIVSETFARRFWNTTDVLGRHVTPDFGESKMFWIPQSRGGALTIVGVARDVREDGRQEVAVSPQIYVAYAQHPTVVVTLAAHAARGPAQSAAAAMRDAVRAVDPDLPLSYEMTFDEIVRETFARPRELAWLIGSFAALALMLSAIGVYGVMAFLTTARRREIGILRGHGFPRQVGPRGRGGPQW